MISLGHMEYIPTFSSISLQTTNQSSAESADAFEHRMSVCACCCLLLLPACLPSPPPLLPVVPPCSLCMRTPCCRVRVNRRECPVRLPAAEGPTARAQPLGSVPVRAAERRGGARLGARHSLRTGHVGSSPYARQLASCMLAGWLGR
jgi:hypothetical protein